MEELLGLKNRVEDFEVEFDVLTPVSLSDIKDEKRSKIIEELNSIDKQLEINQASIDKINTDLKRLTNYADGIDYMVAVASGLIAGAIDSLWVGEFSIDRANSWGDDKVNNFVVKVAQSRGYDGDDLTGAIKFLEKEYGLASDSVTPGFGGGKQHHLRDFAHHPTPVGLIFSLLTQFTGKAYGTNTNGAFIVVEITNKAFIGKDIPQKLLFGVIYWVFHMVSDMAGSHDFAGAGTGLPGPLVSLLKELSVLPFFKNMKIDDTQFSVWISKLFNGTLLGKRDENGKIIEKVKFDLRTEIGVAHEIGRQALPVIINECIVRGFYFIRRFYLELRDNNVRSIKELGNVNWHNTLPFKNRTVIRMLTISSSVFTAVDMADAAIRSAIKSGGFGPAFLSNFVLRVNFVGVGRFAIAVGTDVKMGYDNSKLRSERIALYNEKLLLADAKVYYKQAGMWIAAGSTGETIGQAYAMMDKTTKEFAESFREIRSNIEKVDNYIPEIREKNPGLLEEMSDILTWG